MAKEAGARVKVIMSGHGGDELFAGYRDRYELASSYGHKWDEYWFSILNFVIPQTKMAHWLHPDFASKELLDWPKQAFCEFTYPTRDMSPQARAQHHDLFVYMHGLLLIEDKLSMAHGLESRVPLLDRRIFEFAWTLPDNWKLSASQGKVILRKSLRGLIPDSILQRDKMGFGPPDEHYYRTTLAGFLEMLLLDGSLASRNVIRPNVIKRLVEHQRAGTPLGGTLWTLTSIELWYRTFFDRVSQLRCNNAESLQGPIELFFKEERARISILGNAKSKDMSDKGKPVQAIKRFHQRVSRNIRRKLGSVRELASRLQTNIRHVILPPTFSIYSKKWLARISGRLALDLRTKLEMHLLSTQSPEPHKEIRIFQGLYATVQPSFLRKAWQEGGVECHYETLVWNPNYAAPDLYHDNVYHPDVYYEQVEFWRDVLLPRPFTFIDDHTLNSLWNLLEERWSKYNVFHFDWFLSFLPDNADVEFLRRSGRAVYFHFRGCFILSRKITDQFTKRGKGIQEACAYCQKMGWREEYFARFHKGISNASRVFVSTPNLCHCSSDFEYVPLSLDPDMESLPPIERLENNSSPIIVLHCVGSPGHYAVKGTEHIRKAVQLLAEEGFNVKLKTIENTTRQKALEAMKGGDILVEQLNLGAYGNVAVEAMAYGLPVISSLHPSIKHLVPGCPIVHADPTTLVIRLRELLTDSLMRQEIGKRSYEFVRKFHSNKLVASYLSKIYNADLGMAPTERRNTIANMNPSYE
jgi:glycosyltransferase involved in cell wall biosynthesis